MRTITMTIIATASLYWLVQYGYGQTPAQFEDHHLFASDGEGGDEFGSSVSISGDVAIVGAWLDNTTGESNAGSVYVYRFNGTNWIEEAHLFASDGQGGIPQGDLFGMSISVSGNIAIVGAPADDSIVGTGAGSAYVYRFNGTNWIEETHLFASDGAVNDSFGKSVSISDNVAIVGAFRDDTESGINVGSAYVYRFDGLTWVEEAHLTASDGAADDFFGISVSIFGNIAIVGAYHDDTAAGNLVGSAYIYRFNGMAWVEDTHLFASDGAAIDQFGVSVSTDGNLIIVGALDDVTKGGIKTGSAYVYRFDGKFWVEEAHLFASDGAASDIFGVYVSISDDVAVVGASLDDTTSGTNAGSAYIYRFDGLTWVEEVHLFASDGTLGDKFGNAAVSGDIVIIGAHGDDTAEGANLGSAYIFNVCGFPDIACKEDITPPCGNQLVDIADLMTVLNAFGSCPAVSMPCPADITPPGGNGTVNIDDLVALLNAFGPCP